MKRSEQKTAIALRHFLLTCVCLALLPLAGQPRPGLQALVAESHIVQAASAAEAARLVGATGGEVTHHLAIIQGVAADLTVAQAAPLEQTRGVRIWRSEPLELAGKPPKDDPEEPQLPGFDYTGVVGADALHKLGIDGSGVTLAVMDTGHFSHMGLNRNTSNQVRVLAQYDAQQDSLEPYNPTLDTDRSGHGAHVTSVAVNSANLGNRKSPDFAGIAPNAELVVVKAFDHLGRSSYADVIRGLQWVLDNHALYGIRVLNLSFSAEPQSHYWDDPLNQAVMRLWQAGIVVVASAGNRGPGAMTIGVPGNVPYIITVGAMSDRYTPDMQFDDIIASFSSAGPTAEGFVKPEVVAPGGHITGLMKVDSEIGNTYPEFHDGGTYFFMSGTSQAAAVVSGVVTLMLQADPQLTPDQVKHRLMESARPAAYTSGSDALAYSIFQQGAGMVNAWDAVHSTATENANRGLDIDLDLDGTQHYRGAANAYRDSKGGYVYYVTDGDGNPLGDGFVWSEEYFAAQGFVWSESFVWSEALLWSEGFVWSEAFIWSESLLWSDAFVWSDTSALPASINTWVPQE